ncbi:MAG TPA: tetratricopeptide repeat protein [Sedimentisphaerales bacterium]|nr:tetratricopeptide repeat protein [Sedimentisphaerales bacterium]
MNSTTRYIWSASGGLLAALLCVCLPGGVAESAGGGFEVEIEVCRGQFRTGQYAECIETAKSAIEEKAFSSEWRALMIQSEMALGRYSEAADDVNSVLEHYSLSLRLLKLGYEVYLNNGQTKEASEMLSRIYQIGARRHIDFLDSEDLVVLGETLLLLGGEPRVVLEQFYNRALRKDPDYRRAYLAAGALALAKQDYELAAGQYREAIKRFGNEPDVHCGLARAFYNSDRAEMIKSLDAALLINPKYAPALTLLAEHQIDCEDYDAAAKLLDRVVEVNPWHPEAWAYRALLAYLADDRSAFKTCWANALKFRTTNPLVDHLIGRKLSEKYRFAEGAEYQRGALKLDPDYLPAKIQLAQDLLRLGDEENGWMLADEVHARDAYNVQAYNLANLRDHLAGFRTISADGFILRMNALEAAVYGDTVLKLLAQAKGHLCRKYGVELEKPVTVEMFPRQQDFAVRTFGMPGGDGFLGVCFGNVITANSPKLESPHNWQAMLWHEFCHVVTLNLTQNKMPRWLSEGISVYEESQRDPAWGQRMTPEFRKMVLEDGLVPVGNLSAAFLNPPTPMHLQFAYYESSLVVEFLIERFGLDSLKLILADLANGAEINATIEKRTAKMDKIEEQFAVFAKKRAEELAADMDWAEPQPGQIDASDPNAVKDWLAAHPNSFRGLTLYAKSLIAQQRYEQAKGPLNKLISLYPQFAGEDNAYFLLAEAHRNLGETQEEREALAKLAQNSADAVYAYERLIEIETERDDWPQVVAAADKYLAVYPLNVETYSKMGRANQELGRDDQAVEAYRRVLLLDPADPAEVNYRLALMLRHSDKAAAKRHVLEALADAPRFRDAHRLLLEIVEDNDKAQKPGQKD